MNMFKKSPGKSKKYSKYYNNCHDRSLFEKNFLGQFFRGTEAKKSESRKSFANSRPNAKKIVMFSRFFFLGLITQEKFKITLEQTIQTVKGQDNSGNRIFF